MSGSKKITELTSATSFTGDELLVVVQDGETRQANVRKLDVFQAVQSVNGLTGEVILAGGDITGIEQLVADGGVSSAIASVQSYLLAEISAAAGGGLTDASSDGNAYVRQDGSWQVIPRRPTLVTVSTSTHSPTSGGDGRWFLLTNDAGCSIVIPTSASVGFPLFTLLTYEQDGAAAGIFTGATGVSIRPAPNTSAETGGQGAVVQLFKRTSVFWTIYGALKQS